MNMFPHTVTVYNVLEDEKTGLPTFNITILRGVFLDISKGSNVMKSGILDADSATLHIPMGIKAVNALTGEEQKFIGGKEYERLLPYLPDWKHLEHLPRPLLHFRYS